MKLLILPLALVFICRHMHAQIRYTFDGNSRANGCANVLLQKISSDKRCELVIEINADSLPEHQALDIAKYEKCVIIYFNKYPAGNKYINQLCNDVPYPDEMQPDKYNAFKGTLTINSWNKKTNIISVTVRNIILQNSSGKSLLLPFESFNKLRIEWLGG